MSTEPYTPNRGTVRYRYVDGDYSGGNRDPHAEFDRFLAATTAAVTSLLLLGLMPNTSRHRHRAIRGQRVTTPARV